MRRPLVVGALCAVLSACTPAQVSAYLEMDSDGQTAVVEAVVRHAAEVHGVDPDLLVRIVRCESGLRPEARNQQSGALGLGQHLPALWRGRAVAAGQDPAEWADPTVNADVTAALFAAQGTRPWWSSMACWTRT